MTAPSGRFARDSGPGVGDEVVVEVGPVAHGGHCVARHAGQVIFVRHTLPGEQVRVRITEGGPGDSFLRGDAIEVLRAVAGRVAPPCPFSGPGRCGGCDFQHVDPAEQRRLKAAVVREQFDRLAHLDIESVVGQLRVEPVPGDVAGLGWRTRVQFSVTEQGSLGLKKHRSHEIVEVDRCAIAVPAINAAIRESGEWAGFDGVETVAASDGEVLFVPVTDRSGPGPTVTENVTADGSSARFALSARGFWQVHRGAPAHFVDIVRGMLDISAGERALDLYAGVGLFAAFLAEAVGPTGQVVAVESDRVAVQHAEGNLGGFGNVAVVAGRVDDVLGLPRTGRRRGPTRRGPTRRGTGRRSAGGGPARSPLVPPRTDVIVLDPPRRGAGRAVVSAMTELQPRAIVYVACDPAALARDTRHLLDRGYDLEELRVLDAFPMTHHVECVALLTKTDSESKIPSAEVSVRTLDRG